VKKYLLLSVINMLENILIDKAYKQAGISKTSPYRVEKTLKKEKHTL